MSNNLATERLLAQLTPLVVENVTDDVYAIAPADVAAARSKLSTQPQIGYFLDRGMVIDAVPLNQVGDLGWAIRHASSPRVTTLAVSEMAKTTKSVVAYDFATNAGGVRIDGVVSYAQSCTKVTVTGRSVNGPAGLGTFYMADRSITIKTKSFGPIPMGPSIICDWSGGYSFISQAELAAQLATFASQGYTDIVSTSSTQSLVTATRVAPVVTSPKANIFGYPMIAGPAVCEYAEIIPGFMWILGSFPDVADRIKVVVDAIMTAGHKGSRVDFDKAYVDMKAEADAKMLLFRGSVNYDPLDMWPLAAASHVTLDNMPIDGTLVTSESLNLARANWAAEKWCLTSMSGSVAKAALAETITKDWAMSISIKPSGLESFHLDNGVGILEMNIVAGLTVIKEARLNGRAVTVVEAAFSTAPGFNSSAWAALVAAANDPNPVEELQPTGVLANLGEAICARLITKASFSDDEELLIMPALSPQYFWTKYARKAVSV